jgi:hypothetical protein
MGLETRAAQVLVTLDVPRILERLLLDSRGVDVPMV